MALTTYTAGEVLTAASLNDNLAYAVTVPASTPSALTLISDITVTAASTTNINNCFSATYKNYKVVMNLSASAAAHLYFRWRVGGTDDTTSNYNTAYYYTLLTGAGVGNGRSSAAQAHDLQVSGNMISASVDMTIYQPFESGYTSTTFNNVNGETSINTPYSFVGATQFLVNTSFDGISIFSGSAVTFTGSIKIYGLQNS